MKKVKRKDCVFVADWWKTKGLHKLCSAFEGDDGLWARHSLPRLAFFPTRPYCHTTKPRSDNRNLCTVYKTKSVFISQALLIPRTLPEHQPRTVYRQCKLYPSMVFVIEVSFSEQRSVAQKQKLHRLID